MFNAAYTFHFVCVCFSSVKSVVELFEQENGKIFNFLFKTENLYEDFKWMSYFFFWCHNKAHTKFFFLLLHRLSAFSCRWFDQQKFWCCWRRKRVNECFKLVFFSLSDFSFSLLLNVRIYHKTSLIKKHFTIIRMDRINLFHSSKIVVVVASSFHKKAQKKKSKIKLKKK